ncbi:major facilitator superfamily MFS_1 [Catenulispora acidiphila DSM 44928]|uniref:Major facilitator superfamily MFS_1 n=1 Tax=Catenulispora acidiphila (strain DSM 44928 / JCM 14897 / NBRC 102108 / NRRL B-24433 / ID139908) TaxID=479433 RepID=C7PXD5_CATAD|nr:MFS transporter [Catenulispora acidiphila]ACU69486.1 major facilitator superfamily MFS_1 [Catenulispora acidiphila DSM 44928]
MTAQAIVSDQRQSNYRQVFAIREFRYVFTAHSASMLGSVVTDVSLSVLVLERTGSPFLAALTFALGFMPYAFAGTLLAGIGDRYPARLLLVTCNCVSAATVAVMAMPFTPIWALIVLRFAASTIQPIFTSARAASLPEFLKGDRYTLGRSILRIVNQSTQIIGYATGGLLLLVIQPRQALWIDAASFAVSAVLLRVGTVGRPARITDRKAQGTLIRESLSGARAVVRQPRIRALLFLWWTAPALAGIPEGLAAPYVRQIHAASVSVGLLMASAAVGTIGGEVAIGTLVGPARRMRLVVPLASCSLLPLAVFVLRPDVIVAIALMGLTGVADAYMLGLDQWFLEAVPDELRAQAFSIMFAGIMLTQGLTISIGGLAAEFAAPSLVIAISAAVGTVVIALVCRSVLRTAPSPSSEESISVG